MPTPAPLPASAEIHWPSRFRPEIAPVHVRNALWIDASATVLWAWLIREPLWSTWYANASSNWAQANALRHDLQPGSTFYWQTFGVKVTSQVAEFVPEQRIAWSARGIGLDAYHAWLFVPAEEGCWVLTEESQYGWGARLLNFLMPGRMSRGHMLWLKSLSIESRSGFPPDL
jgi:hypothetical protein